MKSNISILTVTLFTLLSTTSAFAESAAEKQIRKPFLDLQSKEAIALEEAQQRGRLVERELSRYGVSYRVEAEAKPFIQKKDELRAAYEIAKTLCNRQYECVAAEQSKYEQSLIAIHAEIGKIEERAKTENEVARDIAIATYRNLIGAVAFYELQIELNNQATQKGIILETDLMLTFLMGENGNDWFRKITNSSWVALRDKTQYTGSTLFARNQDEEYRIATFGQMIFGKDVYQNQNLESYRRTLESPTNLNSKEIFGASRQTIVSDFFDRKKVGGLYGVKCLGLDETRPLNKNIYCFSHVTFSSVRLR